MSDIAMAARHHHGHHHHVRHQGFSLKSLHLKMPNLSHLMSIAHGAQGPGPQRMFFIGLALLLILIVVAVRKMRRS